MPQSTPLKLIEEMFAVYRRLSSYRDDGVVVIHNLSNDPQQIVFETRFDRPALFNFKFKTPHPYPPLSHLITTNIYGVDVSGAYSWTQHHGKPGVLRELEGLRETVARATGVSLGSAHTIAQLLFDETGGRTFASLDQLTLEQDDLVDGKLCRVVRGSYPNSESACVLFIDVDTLMLRKLTWQTTSSSHDEIRRNIRCNEPLESSAFTRPRGHEM